MRFATFVRFASAASMAVAIFLATAAYALELQR